MDRILASHFEPAQGANYSGECGLQGAEEPSTCVPEYQGNLEPYAVYIAPRPPTAQRDDPAPALAGGQLQPVLRQPQPVAVREPSQPPMIVITPEARGPDQEYEGLGAADVFEVWADIARLYPLNPEYRDITGYSMGGIGTFKLGSQFPDLFARAQPTVGFETNNDVRASMRNLPGPDVERVGRRARQRQRLRTDCREALEPRLPLCARRLSAVRELAVQPVVPQPPDAPINDQFAPAAAFLGPAPVNFNPPHVTYVADTARDRPSYGIVGDHAYWVSGVTIRTQSHTATNGDPRGDVQPRVAVDVGARGVDRRGGDVSRVADGPLSVTLAGCNRTISAG